MAANIPKVLLNPNHIKVLAADSKTPGFGITAKLFLLVFASFVVLIGLLVYLVEFVANEIADSTVERTLESAQNSVDASLRQQFVAILQTARDLARDATLFPQIEAGESASIQDRAVEFQRSLRFDVMIVTDKTGVILARSDDPSAVGEPAAARSQLVAAALRGEEATGIMRRKDELLQIAAVPVRLPATPDVILGTLAVAFRISPELVRAIQQMTGAELAVVSFPPDVNDNTAVLPRVQFTTLRSPESLTQFLDSSPKLINAIRGETLHERRLSLTLTEELYHGAVLPLKRSDGNIEGMIVALRSRSEITRPFERIERGIFLAGGFVLIAALLFALALARRITKPIRELAQSAKAIQEGNYVAVPLAQSNDEIGDLSRAMSEMSKSLKEKEELEDYLADFGTSLEEDLVEHVRPDIDEDEADAVSAHDEESRSETQVLSGAQTERIEQKPEEIGSSQRTKIVELRPTATNTNGNLPTVGARFGERYLIRRKLGSGAFGVVYLAEDLELDELVALKILCSKTLTSSELDLLKHEIKLARQISHHNVVRTHDLGIVGETPFISMEFVSGFTLRHLIKNQGALPARMAVLLARQICSALAAAHREGIVHRDLKPQNMLIDRQGVLKIMDFGLAVRVKQLGMSLQQLIVNSAKSESIDDPAVFGIAGTPPYMSPEQIEGKPLDARTDIYSLGVIFYEMLTAKLPFPDRNIGVLIRRITTEQPLPPSSERQNLSAEFDSVTLRAMAKKGEDRFQTAEEFSHQLAELVSRESGTVGMGT